MRVRFLTLTTLMAVTLSACATDTSNPHEYLDEKTAATVSMAARPIVLARERPELAAHAREYLTLAAAAVNHTGAIDHYLFVYLWSTVDRRLAPGNVNLANDLIIRADDRQIRPPLVGHTPREAGITTAVGAPPGHLWSLHIYRSDLATLRFLSEARQITVTTASPAGQVMYELWDDERDSLKSLVRHLDGLD